MWISLVCYSAPLTSGDPQGFTLGPVLFSHLGQLPASFSVIEQQVSGRMTVAGCFQAVVLKTGTICESDTIVKMQKWQVFCWVSDQFSCNDFKALAVILIGQIPLQSTKSFETVASACWHHRLKAPNLVQFRVHFWISYTKKSCCFRSGLLAIPSWPARGLVGNGLMGNTVVDHKVEVSFFFVAMPLSNTMSLFFSLGQTVQP